MPLRSPLTRASGRVKKHPVDFKDELEQGVPKDVTSAEVPRRVRVAVVTAFPEDPHSPRGGVEAVSVNLVQALGRHADLELHVITTDRGCASPVRRAWNGVLVHRLPWLGRSTLGRAIGPGRRQ